MRKRERLKKLLRLSLSTQSEEAQSAAVAAGKLVVELQPAMWRWRYGIRAVTMLYSDYQAGLAEKAVAGALKDNLLVKASQVLGWRMLKKGRMGVLVGNVFMILPADEAEPLW